MNSILKLYRLLNQTSDELQATMKKVLSPYGLNCNEYAILDSLYQNGEQTIFQLGEEILVTSSSMTYLIDKLEDKGCIRRQFSPEDRRTTIVQLTEVGEDLIQQVSPEHQNKIKEIFSCFCGEEIDSIIDTLERINTAKNV